MAAIGYALILILLLILDFYSISNYREQQEQKNTRYFETEWTQLKSRITEIDDFIMDIYLNNANMKILQSETDSLKLYNASYDLNSQCSARLRMDASMKGYYFSYKTGSRYQFDDDIGISATASNEQRSQILAKIRSVLENTRNGVSWFVMETERETLYVICCKKNRFAIAGIEVMANNISAVKAAKQWNNATFFSWGGQYFDVKSVTEGFGLREKEFDHFQVAGLENGIWKSKMLGKDHYAVYKEGFDKEDLYLYSMVKSNVLGIIGLVQMILLLVTILSVIGAFFIYQYMKKLFLDPLYELTNTMNEIRGGNWEANVGKEFSYEEINEVGDTLNALISEIERLKIASYEEMLDKQKTLMQYLQLQIKPHFYLNCMKMLNALTMQKEYERLQELIINISTNLRYLLYHKEVLVPLGDEVAYVQNYIQLQKSLSLRIVSCEYHIEEEAKDWLIPILGIQTFVENSVKYCVLPAEAQELKLTISAIALHSEEGDFIDLTITDNGEGYPEDVLTLLNCPVAVENERLGVGITNLKKRYAIFYDKPVEYLFQNQGGAVSEMIIPRKDASANEFIDRR